MPRDAYGNRLWRSLLEMNASQLMQMKDLQRTDGPATAFAKATAVKKPDTMRDATCEASR
jgi:hypothetical protein